MYRLTLTAKGHRTDTKTYEVEGKSVAEIQKALKGFVKQLRQDHNDPSILVSVGTPEEV